MLFRRLAVLSLLSCVTTAVANAQTSTIDFSTFQPFSNYDPAPQSAGDHANLNVTGSTVAIFGSNASNVCNYIDMWGPGYSSLNAAGFACGNGAVAQMFFKPTAGNNVTLNSLLIGSYSSVNGVGPSRNMIVKVFDTGWNELFNFSGTVTATNQLNPGVSSSDGLYLQWGTDWNTGVNMIQSTVASIDGPPVTVAPEPASFVLVGAGLGLVAVARRRRRSQV